MSGGRDDTREASRSLAKAAGSLRDSLLGFFRRRIPDASEAEDLVQDVFTRIVSRDSAEPVEHLGGYVYQVAHSVLADRGRRRVVRLSEAHVPLDTERHGDEDFDPARILAGKQDLRRATAALLSLPERTRTVFVLHRLEGRRYREIGEQLGISVSAVEKHMARAVRHLSDSFEGQP